jgi:tetratricopeptide (TPR) repeat protein
MKRNLLFAILFLLILCIPLFFFMKRIYAIKYQEHALQIMNSSFMDSDSIQAEAFKKINLAIRLSPRNYIFYVTKSEMHFKLKQYQQAINELKKIEKFKSNYAEGQIFQGVIYDILQKSDSAFIQYTSALNSLNYRIGRYKNDSILLETAEINRLYLYCLLNDTLQFQLELKRLENIYHGEPSLESLANCDKIDLIKSYFTSE